MPYGALARQPKQMFKAIVPVTISAWSVDVKNTVIFYESVGWDPETDVHTQKRIY